MKTISFLGLELADVSQDELLELVDEQVSAGIEPRYIVTPNPEMYVEASKNQKFLKALKSAWLRLPDGFGLQLYSPIVAGKPLLHRTTGVDFTHLILKHYSNEKIFLIGGVRGAAEILIKQYANVVGYFNGVVNEYSDERIIKEVNECGATIVLVGLGAPKQELWIYENLKYLKTAKFVVGIGGSLDFLSGFQVRAPRFMQQIGTEWLWRLLREPKRLRRIFNAVFLFSFIVFRNLIKLK